MGWMQADQVARRQFVVFLIERCRELLEGTYLTDFTAHFQKRSVATIDERSEELSSEHLRSTPSMHEGIVTRCAQATMKISSGQSANVSRARFGPIHRRAFHILLEASNTPGIGATPSGFRLYLFPLATAPTRR